MAIRRRTYVFVSLHLSSQDDGQDDDGEAYGKQDVYLTSGMYPGAHSNCVSSHRQATILHLVFLRLLDDLAT